MSDQRLRELLHDLADTVPAPALAATTLQGAQRRRRRTALVGAVAAGTAVTVIAVSVGSSSPQPNSRIATSPVTASSPTVFESVLIDVLAVGEQGKLPRLATDLPTVIRLDAGLDAGQAVRLSVAPVDRALALSQSAEDQTSVYVLGSDGKQRLLDTVALKAPTDASGNAQWVLDGTSLSPDGKRAAFAQRDEIVVVDLTTGGAQRVPLGGFNENVLWQPDAQGLIVEQADKTFLLDLRTGGTRQPYAGFDSAANAGVGAGSNIVRLGSADHGGSAVSQWTASGRLISSVRLPATWGGTRDWYGAGWRISNVVARSLFAPPALEPSGAGEVTLAVDVNTGRVVRGLLYPRTPAGAAVGRKLQCCEVRGWLGEDTVLVQNADRLLSWNVRTGQVHLVAQLSPGIAAFALGPIGRR